jgi:hypothetical protein
MEEEEDLSDARLDELIPPHTGGLAALSEPALCLLEKCTGKPENRYRHHMEAFEELVDHTHPYPKTWKEVEASTDPYIRDIRGRAAVLYARSDADYRKRRKVWAEANLDIVRERNRRIVNHTKRMCCV